ncbi:hypothetical protein HZU77_012690 [Neisseriaceae bacterium TC5R-5]|nr:hypothetical protein [Neisseriaceae bacterium TC5R-5]
MSEATVLLAVNGTLMRGLELNPNMLAVGAEFVAEANTAGCYRIWSINDRHPAMMRTPDEGSKVALELWQVPAAGLAQILQNEPAGLSIGKVLLDDGREVLGVLGEPFLCANRTEITALGGWRAYRQSRGLNPDSGKEA